MAVRHPYWDRDLLAVGTEKPMPCALGVPTAVGLLKCPFCEEDSGCSVVHLDRAIMNTRDLDSSSGPSLVLTYHCENGHRFAISTQDHSGGTWVHVAFIGHTDEIAAF